MAFTSLATNQTLTASWADLGSAFSTVGYSFVSIVIDLDINDSERFQIRPLAVETIGDFFLPIESIKKDIVEVEPEVQLAKNDIDQKQLFRFEIDDTVDEVKFQVKVDTVGATAGVVLEAAYLSLGYRQ